MSRKKGNLAAFAKIKFPSSYKGGKISLVINTSL